MLAYKSINNVLNLRKLHPIPRFAQLPRYLRKLEIHLLDPCLLGQPMQQPVPGEDIHGQGRDRPCPDPHPGIEDLRLSL